MGEAQEREARWYQQKITDRRDRQRHVNSHRHAEHDAEHGRQNAGSAVDAPEPRLGDANVPDFSNSMAIR